MPTNTPSATKSEAGIALIVGELQPHRVTEVANRLLLDAFGSIQRAEAYFHERGCMLGPQLDTGTHRLIKL